MRRANTNRVVAAACLLWTVTQAAAFAQQSRGDLATAPAEAAVTAEQWPELLAAGEFSLAFDAALSEPTADGRTERLTQLAAAQAAAGDRYAAIMTSGYVDDADARSDLMAEYGRNGARGGGVQPDFESLISLITTTIRPDSWDELGGQGAISEHAGGVWIDAAGEVHRRLSTKGPDAADAIARPPATGPPPSALPDAPSTLRKVSLTRLERELQWRLAAGEPLDDSMFWLAGLERIQYVLVYPDRGELVIAGPAAPARRDAEGRWVSTSSGRPVVRLDDLVEIFHQAQAGGAPFGCSIQPRNEGLQAAQAYLTAAAARPIPAGKRGKWLEELRRRLGPQDVVVFGVSPTSHAARVLVEADYRMKLVGIGLEEGSLGVPSYLDLVVRDGVDRAPPLDVLRWWFMAHYHEIRASKRGDAFELRGPGARLLSENEWLTATGQRVSTGVSDERNQEFSANFSQHFESLAEKYPIYAELRNLCDLSIVAALAYEQGLADRAHWNITLLADPAAFPFRPGNAPREVDTILNHRVVKRTQIVAAVSGGVRIDPRPIVAPGALRRDNAGDLTSELGRADPRNVPRDRWWWD